MSKGYVVRGLLAYAVAAAFPAFAAACPDVSGRYDCKVGDTNEDAPGVAIEKRGDTFWEVGWPADTPFKPGATITEFLADQPYVARTSCAEDTIVVKAFYMGKSFTSIYRKLGNELRLIEDDGRSRLCRPRKG